MPFNDEISVDEVDADPPPTARLSDEIGVQTDSFFGFFPKL